MLKSYSQKALALGSEVIFTLVEDVKNAARVDKIFKSLWLETFKFEKRFSRFLPSSELSQFNEKAGLEVPISPQFKEILKTAQMYSRQTRGLFNPFILPALHRTGYDKSFVPGYEEQKILDTSKRAVVNIDKLVINKSTAQIPYNTALDLGGIGKGYLADRLAERIPRRVRGFVLSVGGDIVCKGVDDKEKFWRIKIEKVGQSKSLPYYVTNKGGGLVACATSSTHTKQGNKNNKLWHHIINPATSRPSTSNILACTVASYSTASADVLAKCAIITGIDNIDALLSKFPKASLLFQLNSKSKESVKIVGGHFEEI